MKYNVTVTGVHGKEFTIEADNKNEAESEGIDLFEDEFGFFDSITADALEEE